MSDCRTAAVLSFPGGELMIDTTGQIWGAGRRLQRHAAAPLSRQRERAYLRGRSKHVSPPPDEIRFQLAVRGHRLGWISGAPPGLRRRPDMPRRLILPLYSCRGNPTLGQVPQRFGDLRNALRDEFQDYTETNYDEIIAGLPYLPPHIQPLPRGRNFRARA